METISYVIRLKACPDAVTRPGWAELRRGRRGGHSGEATSGEARSARDGARTADLRRGTHLRLNTGEVARVVRLNDGVPARPVVALMGAGVELDLKINLVQRIVGLADQSDPGRLEGGPPAGPTGPEPAS